MKKILIILQWIWILIFLIIVVITIFDINLFENKNDKNIANEQIEIENDLSLFENINEEELQASCYSKKSIKIEGNSMEPLIKNNSIQPMLEWYYKCNEFKINDIVVYKYYWSKKLLIKQLKVSSNDKVEIKNNQLYVNDSILVNSKWNTYNFSSAELSVMKMYIKDLHIPKDSYFIFWDNTSVSWLDSRKFWAVSSDDFIWKVFNNK